MTLTRFWWINRFGPVFIECCCIVSILFRYWHIIFPFPCFSDVIKLWWSSVGNLEIWCKSSQHGHSSSGLSDEKCDSNSYGWRYDFHYFSLDDLWSLKNCVYLYETRVLTGEELLPTLLFSYWYIWTYNFCYFSRKYSETNWSTAQYIFNLHWNGTCTYFVTVAPISLNEELCSNLHFSLPLVCAADYQD